MKIKNNKNEHCQILVIMKKTMVKNNKKAIKVTKMQQNNNK